MLLSDWHLRIIGSSPRSRSERSSQIQRREWRLNLVITEELQVSCTESLVLKYDRVFICFESFSAKCRVPGSGFAQLSILESETRFATRCSNLWFLILRALDTYWYTMYILLAKLILFLVGKLQCYKQSTTQTQKVIILKRAELEFRRLLQSPPQ